VTNALLGEKPAGTVDAGFEGVEAFLEYSLSVQNRRKARAGLAFENHLEALFVESGIGYVRGARTEGKRTPDFLFPSTEAYHDTTFPQAKLTMLGAKTTRKERWRQMLTEAARIDRKHLATLEPGISADQLKEMSDEELTLVVPENIRRTYSPPPGVTVLTPTDFVHFLRDRE
jgi:hypothetical protein